VLQSAMKGPMKDHKEGERKNCKEGEGVNCTGTIEKDPKARIVAETKRLGN